MKTLFLTNEYPPSIYGGAGVHVDYLSRELAKLMEVEVRAFGTQRRDEPNLTVRGFPVDAGQFGCPKPLQSIFGALTRCVQFNAAGIDADVVHCHTWYTHLGGLLAKLNYGIPLVITIHSLEPLRPWKREQLGHGYDFSTWVERTAIEKADAVVAVSRGTKDDVLRLFNVSEDRIYIIYNGIDPDEYRPTDATDQLAKYGVDAAKPYVLFVGRIARQKGIIHLVNAIEYLEAGSEVVLCAGAPDTPEIAAEMKADVERVKAKRPDVKVIWIAEMVPKSVLYQLYSHAGVFVCPSIYEPFGIINLEAMACETPVVASAVGGIKEVVVDGETGFLVPLKQYAESPFEAREPEQFARDLAERVNRLLGDEGLRRRFGAAGRRRAVERFSWGAIARETQKMYAELIERHRQHAG
jgi:alpha-maltose-1-phosphate synthase